MAKIKKISASVVLDGNGDYGVFASCILDNDQVATVYSPSSQKNVVDPNQSANFLNNLIGPKLIGVDPTKQSEIDGWLNLADNTENKSKLGLNTIYSVSSLAAKSGALSLNMPLYKYINQLIQKRTAVTYPLEKKPVPLFPVLRSSVDLFLIPSSSLAYDKSLSMALDVYREILATYKSDYMESSTDSTESLLESIVKAGYKLGQDIFIGIDFKGSIKKENYLTIVNNFIKKYMPLMVIDPVLGNDKELLKDVSDNISKETYLVSDKLADSDFKKISDAIKSESISTFIVKPSQIGTLTETFDIINTIKKANLNYIISKDDNETIDTFIVDFATGVQSEFAMFGSLKASENTMKYNRLLEINQEIKL